MDREIKFRAWNGKDMIEWPEWANGDNFIYEINSWLSPNIGSPSVNQGCKIMQYTGLKDKNGKEIYEGDVLDKKYKWVIYSSKGAFRAKSNIDTSNNNPCLLNILIGQRKKAGIGIEVIGNIYENPELLEQ